MQTFFKQWKTTELGGVSKQKNPEEIVKHIILYKSQFQDKFQTTSYCHKQFCSFF